MTKDLILFIDDQGSYSRLYIEELKQGFEVHWYWDAREAVDGILAEDEASLIVLDIRMPTPPGVSADETEDGQMTGIWILEQVRKTLIERNLPVLILTNRAVSVVAPAVADASIPQGLYEIHPKYNTPCFKLPDLARTQIRRTKG